MAKLSLAATVWRAELGIAMDGTSGFKYPAKRKTWKHTLSPEKNAERVKQMQFCKKVRKALGDQYEVTFYFNPGGVAVFWGETYVKIKCHPDYCEYCDFPVPNCRKHPIPVVEACLSHDFSYIRQWDGRHSGVNHSFPMELNGPERFVEAVKRLSSKPFVRF